MDEISVMDTRQQALRKAMGAFWAQGSAATSYPDIVRTTGLSRKALYELWSDKTSLIHDAIALYRAEILQPLLDVLGIPGRAALVEFWDKLDRAAQDENWCGCYLFRSASGDMRADAIVQAAFDDYIRDLVAAIGRCVEAGQAAGEIDASVDAQAGAWQAVGSLSLLSTIGGQGGYDDRAAALLQAGRRSTGVGQV